MYNSTTTVYRKTPVQNNICVGMLPLKNPLLVTKKSVTSNTNNATKLVLHVSASFLHVSHIAACYHNHVATVVARPDSPATGAFVSQLHCHFQWHKGSQLETHNKFVLQKETCRIQSKHGSLWSFQWNLEISSYVEQIDTTKYSTFKWTWIFHKWVHSLDHAMYFDWLSLPNNKTYPRTLLSAPASKFNFLPKELTLRIVTGLLRWSCEVPLLPKD